MTRPARRTFRGQEDQIASARAFVRDVVATCPLLDEAVLLTSELCTNAIQHTSSGNGGTFEVAVYRRRDTIRVEVRGGGSLAIPAVQDLGDLAERGRGLEIVAMVAHRWGQYGTDHGRCVFFELRWNEAIPLRREQRVPGGADHCAAKQLPGKSCGLQQQIVSSLVPAGRRHVIGPAVPRSLLVPS